MLIISNDENSFLDETSVADNDVSDTEVDRAGEDDEGAVGVFEPFFKHFPEVAKYKTRNIMLVEETDGVPAGSYSFIESYCNDADCDCRKVMVNVYDLSRTGPEGIVATIGYGWERADYYAAWLYGDSTTTRDMAGSYLEPAGRQSPYAHALLEQWKRIIQDGEYRERIKRHYAMFKRAHANVPVHTIKVGRNEPCPCGSKKDDGTAKKYKHCCGA